MQNQQTESQVITQANQVNNDVLDSDVAQALSNNADTVVIAPEGEAASLTATEENINPQEEGNKEQNNNTQPIINGNNGSTPPEDNNGGGHPGDEGGDQSNSGNGNNDNSGSDDMIGGPGRDVFVFDSLVDGEGVGTALGYVINEDGQTVISNEDTDFTITLDDVHGHISDSTLFLEIIRKS